jgi:hypothetical protein
MGQLNAFKFILFFFVYPVCLVALGFAFGRHHGHRLLGQLP